MERPGEARGRGRPRERDRDLGRSLEPGGLAPVEKERKLSERRQREPSLGDSAEALNKITVKRSCAECLGWRDLQTRGPEGWQTS